MFEHFAPKLSQASQDCDVLFLANIQPGLQLQVREQCRAARFVALDSMNLWIDIARDELLEVIGRVDCLMLNDEELRQLTGKPNLISAAREILELARRPIGRGGQAGRVRIGADHRGRLLRAARLSRCTRSSIPPAPATASPAGSSASSPARSTAG